MIYITMCSGEKGEFVSCKAMGHSGFAKQGSDIVCAAVSVLLRTATLDLEQRCKVDQKLKVELLCQEKGSMGISVVQYGNTSFDYLIFLFEFLKVGFTSLVCEYPEFVSLECLIYNKIF